jgi:hypothetical protein
MTRLPLILLPLAVALAACGPPSDLLGTGRSGVTGTVVDRDKHRGKHRALLIREGNGTETWLLVKRSVFPRCEQNEAYPACAR